MYFGKVSRKQFFVKKFVQIFDSYHHVVLHGAAFSSTAWESYTDEYIIRTDFKVYWLTIMVIFCDRHTPRSW